MSVELNGPAVSYVYVAPVSGVGNTLKAIEQTSATMLEDGNENSPVYEALKEVITHKELGKDIVKVFREKGRFLFGARSRNNHDAWDEPFDGLIYAEAVGATEEQPVFSAVQLALWTSAAIRERQSGDQSMRAAMRRSVLVLPDRYDGKFKWGIPVDRATRIGILAQPQIRELSYGHIMDLEAVQALSVPEEEIRVLKGVVTLWHGSNEPDGRSMSDRLAAVEAAILPVPTI